MKVNGVMFNAYPDSIGMCLSDTVNMLKRDEFKSAFSLFYILPTFFNSDLDRGFSIIDYELNRELVSGRDLSDLQNMGIMLKLDLVLNHLSINSPQFKDLLAHGRGSKYIDFFIDWNTFWQDHGTVGKDGCVIPNPEHLDKLFMRKPGLPVMKIRFPDHSDRFFWNTFYQEISFDEVQPSEIADIPGINQTAAGKIAALANEALKAGASPDQIELEAYSQYREQVIAVIEQKRRYLGQIDLNARSEKVWNFYDQTLCKLRDHGAKIVRLDAFAYLHKEPGRSNFFNRPETWAYLERLKEIAHKYDLIIIPEIHAEYGSGLHEELGAKDYPVYDFFFPGLIIDALERGTKEHLLRWIGDILKHNLQTINMLGCHDGIPVLDLRGKTINDTKRTGLLPNHRIDAIVDLIASRGGRIKNLYGADGQKITYYQVNATFFSALGEDERKLRLARAVQLFMPGIPQVWYLDLFAGKNNYEAADRGGSAGHKEINRTNLSIEDITEGLKWPLVLDQLDMIRLRNTSPAFDGRLEINYDTEPHILQLSWQHKEHSAVLNADLKSFSFTIAHRGNSGQREILSYS